MQLTILAPRHAPACFAAVWLGDSPDSVLGACDGDRGTVPFFTMIARFTVTVTRNVPDRITASDTAFSGPPTPAGCERPLANGLRIGLPAELERDHTGLPLAVRAAKIISTRVV